MVQASDFTQTGQGAPFSWRSDGQAGVMDVIPGVVVKVDRSRITGVRPDAFMHGDLLAVCTVCVHFCCTATYRESEIARRSGRWDHLYCSCHDSTYDPYDIRSYRLPEKENGSA